MVVVAVTTVIDCDERRTGRKEDMRAYRSADEAVLWFGVDADVMLMARHIVVRLDFAYRSRLVKDHSLLLILK